MKLSPRAKAVVGRRAPTSRGYRPPVRPMDHGAAAAPGHGLEQRIRRVLLSIWSECGAINEHESQLLRDQMREDGRPLGLVRLERGLRAMAQDCPEAGLLIAAELAQWTAETFPRPRGVQHWGIR